MPQGELALIEGPAVAAEDWGRAVEEGGADGETTRGMAPGANR